MTRCDSCQQDLPDELFAAYGKRFGYCKECRDRIRGRASGPGPRRVPKPPIAAPAKSLYLPTTKSTVRGLDLRASHFRHPDSNLRELTGVKVKDALDFFDSMVANGQVILEAHNASGRR